MFASASVAIQIGYPSPQTSPALESASGSGRAAVRVWDGVMVAAIAFYNRDKPEWQKDMKAIYILALGQVMLGAMTSFLLH